MKAKESLLPEKVKNKKDCVTEEYYKEIINNLRGAVMIAYPAYHGLPPYEGTRVILEGNMDWAFHKHNDYDVEIFYSILIFIVLFKIRRCCNMVCK